MKLFEERYTEAKEKLAVYISEVDKYADDRETGKTVNFM